MTFDPRAVAAFDRRAEEFLASFKALPTPPTPRTREPTSLDARVEGHINADSGMVRRNGPIVARDPLGDLHRIEVHAAGVHEFVDRDVCKQIQELAFRVASSRELRQAVSPGYVERSITGWLEQRRLNNHSRPWSATLMESIDADVRDYTVAIPVRGFEVQKPFKLGRVTIDYIRPAMIPSRIRPEVAKKLRGRVVAIYQVRAEPDRAVELASRCCDEAMEILRFFTHGFLDVRTSCFVAQDELVARRGQFAIFIQDATITGMTESINEFAGSPMLLSNAELEALAGLGLGRAASWLAIEAPNELQTALLNSMRIFARGLLAASIDERLLHAVVAAESLLLPNQEGAIQNTLARRAAALRGETLDQRREIVHEITEGYRLRSEYVHQARSPSDIEAINKMVRQCWWTINHVLRVRPEASRQELVKRLDDILLSGGLPQP